MDLFPLVEQAVWYDQKLIVQILNVVGYIAMITLNMVSYSVMPYDLSYITDTVDVRLRPAGYAFAIWPVIYALLGVFVVY
jgi:hypothetical protein